MAHIDGSNDGVGYGVRGTGKGDPRTEDAGVRGSNPGGAGFGVHGDGGLSGVHGTTEAANGRGVSGVAFGTGGRGVQGDGAENGVFGSCFSDTGTGVWGVNNSPKGTGVKGQSDSGVGVNGVSQSGSGVLGESTTGLAGRFLGNVAITRDLTVSGDVILQGADCTEQFDIEGGQLEPGSVVVVEYEGRVRESAREYDKRVAGVVSGAGDYRPGIVLGGRSVPSRVPIALVGKVYCKVDAQYGPIDIGDLLTSSPTPGCAMKATDSLKAFGAVIGKALRQFSEGVGLIPILVALQ